VVERSPHVADPADPAAVVCSELAAPSPRAPPPVVDAMAATVAAPVAVEAERAAELKVNSKGQTANWQTTLPPRRRLSMVQSAVAVVSAMRGGVVDPSGPSSEEAGNGATVRLAAATRDPRPVAMSIEDMMEQLEPEQLEPLRPGRRSRPPSSRR
jgi:hypothetical protein